MRNIILLFENVKERIDDARNCMKELIPCQAKRTRDNTGLYIKKECPDDEEYNNIMKIKEKYNLKIDKVLN